MPERPLFAYRVFETKGAVDYPVGTFEACSALDALARAISHPYHLKAMREDKKADICIVSVRDKCTNKDRTYYARRAT